jgi:hypothetical protein
VLGLVDLVAGGAKGTAGAAAERGVADVALHLLLVGLLAGPGGGALDGLGDVVGGVLGRVGDLADEALVGLIEVGGRHFVRGLGFEGKIWFGLRLRKFDFWL